MLKIEDNLMKDLKKKNKNFVVIQYLTVSCGWSGGNVKSLRVETKSTFESNDNYLEYEYNDIKVYIHKALQIKNDITIFMKIKLPILGTIIGIKGVTVKNII